MFRNEYPKLLAKGYQWFLESYNTFTPTYPQIFDVRTMPSGFDYWTTGIGMGQLTERAEGDDIVESNGLEGYTVYVKSRTFSDSFYLTMELQEDTPPEKIANLMQRYSQTWAEGVIASKESFAAKFFINGALTAGHDVFNNTISGVITDPTGDLIYDGKPFFAASGNNHPAKDGSTYFNHYASTSLSETNLQTAYTAMTSTNNRNERGEVVSIFPDTLIINPALHFTAKTLLETDLKVGSANNDINTIKGMLKPVEWQYFTDTDAWIMGQAKKGLIFYDRRQPVIDFYEDKKNKKLYVTIDARWGAVVENWRYWIAGNLAAS